MASHTLNFGNVKVHKDNVIRYGFLIGALFMSLDMVAALGLEHWLGEHLAHVFGATGATMSGLSAWIDAAFREGGKVIEAVEEAETL